MVGGSNERELLNKREIRQGIFTPSGLLKIARAYGRESIREAVRQAQIGNLPQGSKTNQPRFLLKDIEIETGQIRQAAILPQAIMNIAPGEGVPQSSTTGLRRLWPEGIRPEQDRNRQKVVAAPRPAVTHTAIIPSRHLGFGHRMRVIN